MASIRELFILGLIARRPTHGYEIKQFMDDAMVENWTNISTTHIYHTLGKLKNAGFIQSRSERVGLQPPREVYSVTPEGEKALTEMLMQDEFLDQKIFFDFHVVLTAIAGMRNIADKERTQVIKRRIEIVENTMRRRKEKKEKAVVSKFDDTPLVQAFSRHEARFIENELQWLYEVLEEIERLGWKAFVSRSHRSEGKQDSPVGIRSTSNKAGA